MLETQRLILRKLEERDLPAFCEMNADPEVMRYFPEALTDIKSRRLFYDLIKRFDQNNWGIWALELKETQNFIGFTGLNHPRTALSFQPCVEVAWRISRQHWRNGFASEAASKALDYAFGELSLQEVVAFTTLTNKASEGVMIKIGMKNTEQDFDHPAIEAGHPLRRHILYKISNDEWRSKNEN